MIKLLTSLLVLVLLLSCSREQELPAGLRAGGFKLADAAKQEMVLKRMAESAIPYKIDERGIIIYMQKDVAKVLGLKREAQYGPELSNRVTESTVVMGKIHRELLESKFEQRGIPYNLRSHNGTENITWLQLYGPKVDVIIQEVGFERFRQATKHRQKDPKNTGILR